MKITINMFMSKTYDLYLLRFAVLVCWAKTDCSIRVYVNVDTIG